MTLPPSRYTLFPYTTLFRSCVGQIASGRVFGDAVHVTVQIHPTVPRHGNSRIDIQICVRLLEGWSVVNAKHTLAGKGIDQHRDADRKSTRLNSSHRTISYAV